jgi:DNA-directed RNA polymerase delta subunit|tara:strand:+ start:551 stop:814 length:264 start_codon:yes stop_codon:yes gene_type:complete
MALSKESTFDYEVRGEFKIIQVRERVAILEDGKEISYRYIRKTIDPSSDVSKESDEVKSLASQFYTDAVKKAYQDHMDSQSKELETK